MRAQRRNATRPGSAPRSHRKEYRQYRLAESLLAHRFRDVRSNTLRDCYLAKIVFIRSYCDFFINCRTTEIVRSFVRLANPRKRFCAGEQPNRCHLSPRRQRLVEPASVKLSRRQIAPEQIAERQAVDAVAVTGNGEIVRVGVHVANHGAHVEQTGDRLVAFVANLHVLARA